MAFDAIATNQLANNPMAFLATNYVRASGVGGLTKVFAAKNAAIPAQKILGGTVGTIAYGHPSLAITDSDCNEITGIGGRGLPTAYIGLDRQADRDFLARIQDAQDATHPLLVYFLPAAANQISRLQIPGIGGPSLIMTDPLSGCTIFTSDSGVLEYVYHANGLAVAPGLNDARRIYMRDLFRHYVMGTPQAAVRMFDMPFYANDLTLFEANWRANKAAYGRALATINTVSQGGFNVFGIRGGGPAWTFHYQMATTVSSVRTGVKAFFKGAQSRKFKVSFQPLPAVPLGGVPNP